MTAGSTLLIPNHKLRSTRYQKVRSSVSSSCCYSIKHTGANFKKCMTIGDYFHSSNFGFFDTQAGEMLAYVGSDSDSESVDVKLSIIL